MPAFQNDLDIRNRALLHCGAKRIASASEISVGNSTTGFAYDKLREAELQANLWTFAIKKAALRAVDTTTMLLSPSLWSAGTTYFRGSIVTDELGNVWISTIPSNLANDPLLTNYWEPYFGPMTVSLFVSGTTYLAGELVYTATGDGTYRVYLCLTSGNSDTPGTATAWDATTTYFQDQVVTYLSVAYKSLVDLNINQQPNTHASQWTTTFTGGAGSINWLEIGGAEFPGVALTTLNIVYPIDAGPSSQTTTRNIFRLPASYLRHAPQDPKQATRALGGPSGVSYDDWVFENGYLVTNEVGPIVLRFVASITDVRRMPTMFCEGLAARIATEVANQMTQSNADVQMIGRVYKDWIGQAKIVDAIEDQYTDLPDDEFVSVRA